MSIIDTLVLIDGVASKTSFVIRYPYLRYVGGRPYTLHIQGHPFHFPGYLEEVAMLQEIFLRKEYDHGLPLRPTRIIDLGANIGLASLWFAQKFPKAHIDAYEPNPMIFRFLKKNLAPYNVTVHEAAVAGQEGSVTLYIPERNAGSSISTSSWAFNRANKPISVRGVSLDTVIGAGADVLKLDIEGAEFEVLGSSTKLGLVQTIIGEAHPDPRHSLEDLSKAVAKTHTLTMVSKNIFLAQQNEQPISRRAVSAPAPTE